MLTELITRQAGTLAVMAGAGVLTETLWQVLRLLQRRASSKCIRLLQESLFWAVCCAVIPEFLYYAAYGRLSVHAFLGFSAGVLLWKKICCGIISAWVKDDEVQNSKTTARSSTWSRPENKGWKKEGRKERKKKRKLKQPPDRIQEEKWLSEKTARDGE